MKKNNKHILPILFVLSLGFVSCSQKELDVKEETPETVVEEEVWTLKVEAGEKASKVKAVVDVDEVPNSLLIPIYKGATAKKGDIVLTWWQSGSGMERAIVTDDSDPTQPKVHYLDLSYKGDGSGFAEKHDNEQLKPNSFVVLNDGEWQPGAPLAVKDDGKYNKFCKIAERFGVSREALAIRLQQIGMLGKYYNYQQQRTLDVFPNDAAS